MTFLKGYRTYILGFLGLITVGLYLFQVIDVNTANIIEGVLGFGSVLSLRAALQLIRLTALIGGLVVSFLFFAIPVKAQAPIQPVALRITTQLDIVAYATQKAVEAHISPAEVLSIIACESDWNTNAIGDHGTSFGLSQIHLPAHPEVSREMADDPVFAIDFLVRNLKEGSGDMWTCYAKAAS